MLSKEQRQIFFGNSAGDRKKGGYFMELAPLHPAPSGKRFCVVFWRVFFWFRVAFGVQCSLQSKTSEKKLDARDEDRTRKNGACEWTLSSRFCRFLLGRFRLCRWLCVAIGVHIS